MTEPKYYYPPKTTGTLTFGVERFMDMLEEIQPLHHMHYEETETEYLDHPYNPNYPSYMDMETRNALGVTPLKPELEKIAALENKSDLAAYFA